METRTNSYSNLLMLLVLVLSFLFVFSSAIVMIVGEKTDCIVRSAKNWLPSEYINICGIAQTHQNNVIMNNFAVLSAFKCVL